MTIRIFEGLLPIIRKTDGACAIEEKTKEKIQNELNQQAERERLAKKTTNNDPNTLHFETIDHSLFRIFDREDNTPLLIENNTGILTLIPVGNLSLLDYEKGEPGQPPVTTLNMKDYVEERQASQMQMVVSTQPDFATAMDVVDEDHFSSSQYARDVLEDVLRPGQREEQPDEQPVQQPAERSTGQPTGQPAEQSTDQPARDKQITIESSDSEMEDVEQTIVPAELTTVPVKPTTESAEPIAEPADPTTVPAEPLAVPTLHETMSNVSDESVSSPPTIITPTAPRRLVAQTLTTEAETIESETASKETTTEEPTTHTDHWYGDDMITTNALYNLTSKIFAYKPQMIPIFPTETQQKLCDKAAESSKVTKSNALFNVSIEKMMDILNFPSSGLDTMSEEQWNQSGKTMFIKNLLQSLSGMDLVLLLVGKDLTEEEALLNMAASILKLDCVRINYLLDDGWSGEYGVFVKTAGEVNQNKGTAERGGKFSRSADFIICMDIRTSKDNSLFGKIMKRGTTNVLAPVSWLVSVGSVEERAFNFLAERNIPYSGRKSDDLKEVMIQDNDWQHDSALSLENMNSMVADNVKYWLTNIKSRDQYQYRSTIHLPRSYLYAHLKPMPVITEENTSDMDIGSDSEDTQTTETHLLSGAAISYVDKVIIPAFDTNSGTLVETDHSQIYNTLTDQEKHLFDSLPKSIYTDYRNEVTNLKRQYETAFRTLHDKYYEDAISKLENARQKNV
ncbi:hypothetical protein HPULCUR_001133 [Helicostylum pulchrum]|uniref:Uncharacterized protein n=1 Tax=Helicostylum pulchrum TaxID=562976 RepID=A0ABP9XLV8_9FUNG